ncbi:hypothetical protein D3C84_422640 [compost metagenome]
MIVVTGQRQRAAGRQHQAEGGHAGEMHADNARPEHQAGAEFDQLMEQARAFAQSTRQQQRREAGANGDDDGKDEQHRFVIRHRIRTHRRHAHVMHDRDAQANANGRLDVLPDAQVRMTEGVHRQPRGEQGNQQGGKGDGQFVLNLDRRLKRQHADEVHGPDAACQASGADPAPQPL